MSRRCSDPHDNIYGLLGTATEQEAACIVPDYNKPVSRVYQEATLSMIQGSGKLDIFSMQFPQLPSTPASTVQGRPSWVPDWTQYFVSRPLGGLESKRRTLGYYNA